MISPRSFLLLSAVLAAAAAASSHAPNRWGLQTQAQMPQPQRPPTAATQRPPAPAMPAAPPAQNATGDMQEVIAQMAAIMVPKIQAKLQVLFGNIGRAITGAIFATFRTGFKTPLTAMFVPLDKTEVASAPLADLEGLHPPGYIGDEGLLRTQETTVDNEPDQATERKLT